MKIMEIELQNGSLYSPRNGELLFDDKIGVNMNATTLAGLWEDDFHNPYYEHFIADYDIGGKWADYVNDITLSNISNNDKDMESRPDPEDFILKYDKDPVMIGFRLKLSDRRGAYFWILLKMSGPVEID